jgi:CheY-like chemotaxis protein
MIEFYSIFQFVYYPLSCIHKTVNDFWGHTYLSHKKMQEESHYNVSGYCIQTVYEKFELYLINMTDQSVMFINDQRSIIIMRTNDNSENNNIRITPEERIRINIEYLTWLYTKSKERKKQNKDLLFNTRRAIELVIKDTGGERALKELFLKEQDEKIIDELAKSNPKIQEKFKQDREAGLQALSAFIADLENSDCLNILQGANAIDSGVSSAAASNSKRRILVVDDEPDILLTLNAVLSEQGHYVKTFENPAEALSHLTSSSNNEGITPYYDLIITDHRMPGTGITGLDLAKRVKDYSRAKGTKTKVFLMSASVNAWSLPEEFIEALKPGIVDEIIQKPISNDKLIAIIEKSFFYNNDGHWHNSPTFSAYSRRNGLLHSSL